MIFTLLPLPVAVLKTIENLGVSHVKLSEQYTKKLEAEFKTLSFPYRPEAVSMHFIYYLSSLTVIVQDHFTSKAL